MKFDKLTEAYMKIENHKNGADDYATRIIEILRCGANSKQWTELTDLIEKIKEDAFSEGYDNGYDIGYDAGRD